MGTNSKLHVQFSEPPLGRRSAATARPSPTRGYQSTWEVTRASQARPASSSTTPAGRSARASAPARRRAGAAVPRPDRARAAGDHRTLERPRDARLLAGQPLDEGLLLVLEGRPVHERSPASSASAEGELPLRRRAHLDRLPGLPQRRRRDGAVEVARKSIEVCSPAKWQFPCAALDPCEALVLADLLVRVRASSRVAGPELDRRPPVPALVEPGRTGSSCARNCSARDAAFPAEACADHCRRCNRRGSRPYPAARGVTSQLL